MLTGYLAAEGFEPELRTELQDRRIVAEHGRLLLAEGEPVAAAWAANIWHQPQEFPIASIGEAAGILKGMQRNWAAYAPLHHRRAKLIQEKLPHVSAKPLRFGDLPPKAPMGSFTLLAPDRMLASGQCSSPLPHGDWAFQEDREGPPSRAYLKLWEALTRFALLHGEMPKPGEATIDLGACPGGWTWVLAGLGARVDAIDKAPLAPNVAAMPGVTWRQGSAFALDPRQEPAVDWLCCDVICYPARLLALVQRWIAADKALRMICTLKFQGETDHATAAAFAAIPGGTLLHLHHNKHELTWLWRKPGLEA